MSSILTEFFPFLKSCFAFVGLSFFVQGNHKLQPFSPQFEHLTKKNQIHSTTITTTNNSNNNNLNAQNPLLKPVRPSSYWPVPDESLLSSDQIQTDHQNNNSCNNKEVSCLNLIFFPSY